MTWEVSLFSQLGLSSWYRRPDSNRHGPLAHWILSPRRLPVTPLRRVVPSCLIWLGTDETLLAQLRRPRERRVTRKEKKLTLLSSSIFIIAHFCLFVKISLVAEIHGSTIVNQIFRSLPFFIGGTPTAKANWIFSTFFEP